MTAEQEGWQSDGAWAVAEGGPRVQAGPASPPLPAASGTGVSACLERERGPSRGLCLGGSPLNGLAELSLPCEP